MFNDDSSEDKPSEDPVVFKIPEDTGESLNEESSIGGNSEDDLIVFTPPVGSSVIDDGKTAPNTHDGHTLDPNRQSGEDAIKSNPVTHPNDVDSIVDHSNDDSPVETGNPFFNRGLREAGDHTLSNGDHDVSTSAHDETDSRLRRTDDAKADSPHVSTAGSPFSFMGDDEDSTIADSVDVFQVPDVNEDGLNEDGLVSQPVMLSGGDQDDGLFNGVIDSGVKSEDSSGGDSHLDSSIDDGNSRPSSTSVRDDDRGDDDRREDESVSRNEVLNDVGVNPFSQSEGNAINDPVSDYNSAGNDREGEDHVSVFPQGVDVSQDDRNDHEGEDTPIVFVTPEDDHDVDAVRNPVDGDVKDDGEESGQDDLGDGADTGGHVTTDLEFDRPAGKNPDPGDSTRGGHVDHNGRADDSNDHPCNGVHAGTGAGASTGGDGSHEPGSSTGGDEDGQSTGGDLGDDDLDDRGGVVFPLVPSLDSHDGDDDGDSVEDHDDPHNEASVTPPSIPINPNSSIVDDSNGGVGEWVEGDDDAWAEWSGDGTEDGGVKDEGQESVDGVGFDIGGEDSSVRTGYDEILEDDLDDRGGSAGHEGDGEEGELTGDLRKVRAPGARYAASMDRDQRGFHDPTWAQDDGSVQTGVALGDGRAAAARARKTYSEVRGKLHEFSEIGRYDPNLARSLQLLEWKLKRPIAFTMRDVRALDFLSRWSYATTAQIARVGGWRDRAHHRMDRRFENWTEFGFARWQQLFGGPRLWYVTDRGALHSQHPWMGGVSVERLNPMSQSHTIGLSSVASWLLAPDSSLTRLPAGPPDVLGLGDEWPGLREEIGSGEAVIISEREYRSSYSKIRNRQAGLLPVEYRRALLGASPGMTGGDPIESLMGDWASAYRKGVDDLGDAPDWRTLEYESQGADMWLWVIWGNYVWCKGDVVPIESRLDRATNRPKLRRDLGDEFALLDHLPDMVIARKRDPSRGTSRSIAVELELSMKDAIDYRRIMASYHCDLGRTLYDRVVWLVPNHVVGDAIAGAADDIGMGEDEYSIVPFATAERKNSFFTGADIIPGRWEGRHKRVVPLIDPEGVLLS
jgi:hypothetical protein